MSLWVLSSSFSSPGMLQALVLTALLMQLGGCVAAGTANHVRRPAKTSNTTSPRELQSMMLDLDRLLKNEEPNLTNLNSSILSLNETFNEYSKKSARHAWPTVRKQHNVENGLRKNAEDLEKTIETLKRRVQPMASLVDTLRKDSAVRSLARDAPNKKQMEQNIKVYDIMMELIQTFLECPKKILEILNAPNNKEGSTLDPYYGVGEPDETVYPEYY